MLRSEKNSNNSRVCRGFGPRTARPLRRAVAIGVGLSTGLALGAIPIAGASASVHGPKAPNGGKSPKSSIVIGFSQSYTGNSYRKALDVAFNKEAAALEKEGRINSVKFEDANNSASTQESQISDLILEHVSVLLIDPASPTALNGVIAKAASAHIPVLVFNDGPVTSKVPYQLDFNNPLMDEVMAKYIAKRLHGSGNVLEIRGIAGTATDEGFHQGVLRGFKPFPHIHIVGSIYGNWTESVTESAVASAVSGLPKVNAIITQGGEGYGAIKAFQAAGRRVPLVVFGNRGYSLHWWWKEHAKNGYTSMSISANPGIGAAAAYVGWVIASGGKVPKNMTMPLLSITQAQLHSYLSVPLTGIAIKVYPNTWYRTHLLNQ